MIITSSCWSTSVGWLLFMVPHPVTNNLLDDVIFSTSGSRNHGVSTMMNIKPSGYGRQMGEMVLVKLTSLSRVMIARSLIMSL